MTSDRLTVEERQRRLIEESAAAAIDRHIGIEPDRAACKRQIAIDDIECAAVKNPRSFGRRHRNILVFDLEPLIDRA